MSQESLSVSGPAAAPTSHRPKARLWLLIALVAAALGWSALTQPDPPEEPLSWTGSIGG